jgi:tetratricopeptide (TPR) repeat protein
MSKLWHAFNNLLYLLELDYINEIIKNVTEIDASTKNDEIFWRQHDFIQNKYIIGCLLYLLKKYKKAIIIFEELLDYYQHVDEKYKKIIKKNINMVTEKILLCKHNIRFESKYPYLDEINYTKILVINKENRTPDLFFKCLTSDYFYNYIHKTFSAHPNFSSKHWCEDLKYISKLIQYRLIIKSRASANHIDYAKDLLYLVIYEFKHSNIDLDNFKLGYSLYKEYGLNYDIIKQCEIIFDLLR